MLTILLGYLAARLIDPIAIALCAGSAPLIGNYRIAIPAGSGVYVALYIATGWINWEMLAASAAAGAILSAGGLFLWNRLTRRAKSAATDKN